MTSEAQITRTTQREIIADVWDSTTGYAPPHSKPGRGEYQHQRCLYESINQLVVLAAIARIRPGRVPRRSFRATRERTRFCDLGSPQIARFQQDYTDLISSPWLRQRTCRHNTDESLILGAVDSASGEYTVLAFWQRRKFGKPSHIADRNLHLGNFRGTCLATERVKLPRCLVIILGFDPADLEAIP